MQKNRQGTSFVTASKDRTAKLFDVDDLSVHKVYVTEHNTVLHYHLYIIMLVLKLPLLYTTKLF